MKRSNAARRADVPLISAITGDVSCGDPGYDDPLERQALNALEVSTVAIAESLIGIIGVARVGVIRIWVYGDAGLYAPASSSARQWERASGKRSGWAPKGPTVNRIISSKVPEWMARMARFALFS